MVIHPIFHCVCRNWGNFFPHRASFSQLQHSLEIANRFENGKFKKYLSPKSVGSWYRNLFMRDLVPRFSIRKFRDFPSNLPHVSSESFLQWPRCHFWGMIQPFQDNTESLPSPLGKITNMLWRKRWWPSRLSGFPFHSNSIRESLNLTGNPPWIHLLAGNTEPRPNLQRRLYLQWLPQSIPHNRAMFCKFWEVCLHFRQKYTWSKFCTVYYNIGWVQISQQGYDRKIKQSE